MNELHFGLQNWEDFTTHIGYTGVVVVKIFYFWLLIFSLNWLVRYGQKQLRYQDQNPDYAK